ncbi:MAG: carbamoyl phosphate synthase large subunit [Rhodobacteraceae bacterium]|nr:MAG: carbamoyl phosphate synthase large subunit [Paracoccaceae bacterium]
MPKRKDISSIMIIGAGPIIIGQACEFDYSGTQACKALKEEGYRVILVNSNPATIMTDPEIADSTYVEPINVQTLEAIIRKEKPDALLPTMGGQTGLNAAISLEESGILAKEKVELIGAKKEAIEKAEDRRKFRDAMDDLQIESPKSNVVENMEDASNALEAIGLPAVIRPAFTLGGAGGGIAYNEKEYFEICRNGLDLSPVNQILIDESLLGWKEFELEVVRDKMDNAIVVCSIENVDPMGVHTGDSITVAPAMTLTDKEYQLMRTNSIRILRKIGVETGGSNVQWAINPEDGRMVVIEMNPRVSRSSALASKATGFPIAKVATKLAVGFTLDELINDITKTTPASFEPTIDYVVVKIPRFTFEKFSGSSNELNSTMKSVGEVMAIGRSFHESLQKALASLETGLTGLNEIELPSTKEEIISVLSKQNSNRLRQIVQAMRSGIDSKTINQITRVDSWFLERLEEIIAAEQHLKENSLPTQADELQTVKSMGFTDARLGELTSLSEDTIRQKRWQIGVRPSFKRVDTCAGEFPSKTPYMYSTYEALLPKSIDCESSPNDTEKIIIIGSGPNRIGQGIEFDYCCCHASFALSNSGIETIMINCNPETVSTDYDTSDRLYFEPLTVEHVLEVVEVEKSNGNLKGVIIQLGGQTPLNLTKALSYHDIQILGTSPSSIDLSEDREKFQDLLNRLNLKQPKNGVARSEKEAISKAKTIGYPVVIRPSYVIGGRAMEVVLNPAHLMRYIKEAVQVSGNNPVLIDNFIEGAIEIDVDAISDGKKVTVVGVMQHVEEAGIHSGDSACSLPPYSLSKEIITEIKSQTKMLAIELKVVGLMNVQFAVKGNSIFVLEVNPRASRTLPFVSKAIGVPIPGLAALLMAGITKNNLKEPKLNFYAVKEVVLPFDRFPGVDILLGPEMRSTGEVMGIDKSFEQAFLKAQLATGVKLPQRGTAFVSVKNQDKNKKLVEACLALDELGIEIIATKGTAIYLKQNNISVTEVKKAYEGRPNIIDFLNDNKIDIVFNTTAGLQSIIDSQEIRTISVAKRLPYFTSATGSWAAAHAMKSTPESEISIISLQELKTIREV